MRYIHAAAIALILTALVPSPGQGAPTGLSIPPTGSNYVLVSSTRVTRTQFYYTYQAILVNNGSALAAVTAVVTSLDPTDIQIVPGEGTLHFSPVPANSQVTSIDTFTVEVNNGASFDFSDLQWTFNGPIANPGPNQTVGVDTLVTLNGSASTNPSATGSLTYTWSFQSIPAGSRAVLSNANMMTATFTPDVAGTYTILLTVNNGSASDSAAVTVSTESSGPVANAGSNQTVAVGTTVQLDGSKSTDADGNQLTYQWSFVSIPPSSRAVLSGRRSIDPTFTVDVPGAYIVQLVVSDGTASSLPSAVTVSTGNTPPVANAGPNQNVDLNALVQLNGSASTDTNGNPLTYQWSLNLTQAPGSMATLSNPSAVNPTFTADVAGGTYVAQLIVNDGVTNSQPVTVTITTNAIQAPNANAGANQSVVRGTTVQLDGSASTDLQGYPLTYTWSLITTPMNSTAVLSATNIFNPTFVADQTGTYVAQLIVNNGHLPSAPSTVTITTTDITPVANAGANQSVSAGTAVVLDGSQSHDPDGQPLTYSWAFLSIPPASNAMLTGSTTVNPNFVADEAGTYVVQLIVSDPTTSSLPSTVTINAGIMTLSLSPDQLNLTNSPGILTLMLNPATGASPVSVSLVGFDPSVISVPSPVTIPPNTSGVNVTVTPLASGTTEVFAHAAGYQAGSASVTVATPSLSIALNNGATAVGLTHSVGGTITLSAPAPANGTTVTLSNDSSSVGQVSFNPMTVTFLQGSSTGTFSITGVAVGSLTIDASAPGYNGATAPVLVTLLGGIGIAQGVQIQSGGTGSLNVALSTPAPADGVTITLVSSNSGILTVPPSVFIPQGSFSAQAQVSGSGTGAVSVTASASGYTGDSETVNVVGSISLSPSMITENVGDMQTINIVLSASAPASGLTVNLSSSDMTIATVPPSISISGLGGSVTVTGVGAGSATITASSTNQFFIATGASVSVTVTAGP